MYIKYQNDINYISFNVIFYMLKIEFKAVLFGSPCVRYLTPGFRIMPMQHNEEFRLFLIGENLSQGDVEKYCADDLLYQLSEM